MLRIVMIVALAVASFFVANAQSPPAHPAGTATRDALTGKVDQIFSQWDKPGSPGCALGIIRDGRLIYKRGYGMANLDYDVPLNSESVFYIASTSKQFTAASILLLARRGVISLDDDIRKYTPEIPKYENVITIRHLVHHTSGLRDYLELMSLAGKSLENSFGNEDALDILSRQKAPNFRPGEEHLYSNSNYVLMAEVVKRASGKSLREFAEENIFRPLGMKDTHFNDDRTTIVKNRVISYGPGQAGQLRYFIKNINAVGDGNLLTTVEDLYRWDQSFYHDKVGGSSFTEQMLARGKLNSGKEIPYAFGLGHGEYRGLKTVSHGGGFLGFRTQMLRFPEQRFSVICLCNLGTINPTSLAYKVADLYLANQFKAATADTPALPASLPKQVEPATLTEAQLAEYSGEYYCDELDVTYRLALDDGKLRVKVKNSSRGFLVPHLFLVPPLRDELRLLNIRYVFTRDHEGRITGFTLNSGRVQNLRFDKKAAL
jgi:CubicO group peptidase (beta-lactamase class C family)